MVDDGKKVFLGLLSRKYNLFIEVMGGGNESRIIYQDNPNTIEALNNLRSKYNQLNYKLAQQK